MSRALVEYQSLDDADRTRILEIELRAEYGGPLAGVHGLLGDPVVANYARLEALEADATDIGDRLAALLALTARYPQVAAMGALMNAGLKLLDIADTLEMPLFRAVGHMMYGLGATSISPDASIDHLEAVETLAEEGHVPPPFSDYAPDLLVLAIATKSIVVGSMGRVGEARAEIASALLRSEVELAHPFSMGTALTLAATVHVWFSEPEHCLAVAARAVELAQRHGFSNFEAMNLVQLGWALTATGADGSDRVRTGLKLLATSTMSSYPHQLRVAAMEALLRGATGEARPLLDEGFAFAESNGETGHLPQLHRILGWVERDEGRPDRAAASLRAAYDIAAEAAQWLTAFDAARELCELGTTDQPQALEMLRAARNRLVGAADLPAIVAADALLR